MRLLQNAPPYSNMFQVPAPQCNAYQCVSAKMQFGIVYKMQLVTYGDVM
jgi:hypothetical protein